MHSRSWARLSSAEAHPAMISPTSQVYNLPALRPSWGKERVSRLLSALCPMVTKEELHMHPDGKKTTRLALFSNEKIKARVLKKEKGWAENGFMHPSRIEVIIH